MRYETFVFIIKNKRRFMYDAATSGGTDQTTDPGAATAVNPNQFLAPVIGGSQIQQALTVTALILIIIYLSKKMFY